MRRETLAGGTCDPFWRSSGSIGAFVDWIERPGLQQEAPGLPRDQIDAGGTDADAPNGERRTLRPWDRLGSPEARVGLAMARPPRNDDATQKLKPGGQDSARQEGHKDRPASQGRSHGRVSEDRSGALVRGSSAGNGTSLRRRRGGSTSRPTRSGTRATTVEKRVVPRRSVLKWPKNPSAVLVWTLPCRVNSLRTLCDDCVTFRPQPSRRAGLTPGRAARVRADRPSRP